VQKHIMFYNLHQHNCEEGTRTKSGLWIRIHLIRIRIQHFCSIRIRIRIQAKTELLKKIFFKSKFESNQIKNIGVNHPNFFQKVPTGSFTFLLVKFLKKITKKCIFSSEISCPWIRIPNTDPDPTKSLNPDPIRSRIHNPGQNNTVTISMADIT
jgi:hypothetical protein